MSNVGEEAKLAKELEARFNIHADARLKTPELVELLAEIQQHLAMGTLTVVEAAAPGDAPRWRVNQWLKRALLLQAQLSGIVRQPQPWAGTALELAPWRLEPAANSVIPFGCHVRSSAYLAGSVAMTPPSVIQAGAHVGVSTVLDAHAMIGNCARVGSRVVLQAGAIVAGQLFPLPALPNIVEDDCLLGGSSGLYDGVILGAGSILQPGTILSAREGVLDLRDGSLLQPDANGNLWIPPMSVVAQGSRRIGPAALGVTRAMPLIIGTRENVTSMTICYAQDPQGGEP